MFHCLRVVVPKFGNAIDGDIRPSDISTARLPHNMALHVAAKAGKAARERPVDFEPMADEFLVRRAIFASQK